MPRKKNKYKLLSFFGLFALPEDPEEHNHCHCEGNI
jgi:hypothetical protein